jgi:hypothetical protein
VLHDTDVGMLGGGEKTCRVKSCKLQSAIMVDGCTESDKQVGRV